MTAEWMLKIGALEFKRYADGSLKISDGGTVYIFYLGESQQITRWFVASTDPSGSNQDPSGG